jgi:hypothetical protein
MYEESLNHFASTLTQCIGVDIADPKVQCRSSPVSLHSDNSRHWSARHAITMGRGFCCGGWYGQTSVTSASLSVLRSDRNCFELHSKYECALSVGCCQGIRQPNLTDPDIRGPCFEPKLRVSDHESHEKICLQLGYGKHSSWIALECFCNQFWGME